MVSERQALTAGFTGCAPLLQASISVVASTTDAQVSCPPLGAEAAPMPCLQPSQVSRATLVTAGKGLCDAREHESMRVRLLLRGKRQGRSRDAARPRYG